MSNKQEVTSPDEKYLSSAPKYIPSMEELLRVGAPLYTGVTANGLTIEIYHENETAYGGFIDGYDSTIQATWEKDGRIFTASLDSFCREDASRYFNFSRLNLEIHNLLNLMIMAGDHNDFANRLVKSGVSPVLGLIRDNPSQTVPDFVLKSIIKLLQEDPFQQSVQYYVERLKSLNPRVADFDFPELRLKLRKVGVSIGNDKLDEELIGTPRVYNGYEIDMTSLNGRQYDPISNQ